MAAKSSSTRTDTSAFSKPAGMVVNVTAPGGYRRRAGLDFNKIAVPVALDDLDDDQFKAILDDPMLSVRPADPAQEPGKDA